MRPSWSRPWMAAAMLVLANAVPLVGVVGFGWDLYSLLVVYWLESAAVGVAFVAKIWRADGTCRRSRLSEPPADGGDDISIAATHRTISTTPFTKGGQ